MRRVYRRPLERRTFYDKLEKTKQEYKSKNTNEKNTREVTKGVWRMPWLSEATKDVISCGEAQIARHPRISEWGNPARKGYPEWEANPLN